METKLKVKTRRNQSPEGKARVFFACHKEDFEEYFENVTDEILNKQNCAIYYYEPETIVEDEDRRLDLLQMQLFVFPVTERFLTDESDALNIDFRFAKENKRAILPLMQEGGLDRLFNTVCGNIQFLYKFESDPTAISYDKKLGDFLKAVLLSDEQMKKIKDAFDAYVFLSYRKKDRQYAQKIMHLIHENDFCRDVAIWYDEFLVPGEDFNKAILNAIENSKLFALVVTPNLNEPNYIQEKEYPAARDRGMHILPLEAVPTDRRLLEDKYEDIPECTYAEDKDELSKMLGEHLKGIALRSDSSPEHNFFIGLAYLTGIDVEIDYEKALCLIESAAQSSLKEAIEKMADIYAAGIGVSRDYIQEIYWREKLVDIIRQEFEENKTDKSRMNYIQNLMKLMELYHIAGEYSLIIGLVKSLWEEFKDEPLLWEEEIMLDNMRVFAAQAKIKSRDFDGAAVIYKELCDKYEEKDEDKFRDYALLLASCYNNLIALCRESENFEFVVDIVGKAMDVCEKMAEEYPHDSLSMMASNCSNAAGVLMHMGEDGYEIAEEWLKDALKIETALCGNDEKRYGVDIARNYDNLGLVYMHLGNSPLAGDMYKTAKRIFDMLRRDNSELYLRDVAVNLSNLGQWYQMNGKPGNAVKYYLEAIEIEESLSKDNSEAYEVALGRSYMSAGDACMQIGDDRLPEARGYIEKSIELKAKAAARTPDMLSVELAESYLCMGVLNHNEKNWEDAKSFYDMAEEILIAADEKMPDCYEHMFETLYRDLGGWHIEGKSYGQSEEAMEHYKLGLDCFEKANKILEKLIRKNPGYYERRLVDNYLYLKGTYSLRGERKNAINAGLSALEYRKRMLKRRGVSADADYAELCVEVGMMCAAEKDKKGARRLFNEAKEIYIKLSAVSSRFKSELIKLEACLAALK